MISRSITASPGTELLNCTSSGAFPAPLVNTVKCVGLPLSTPEEKALVLIYTQLTQRNSPQEGTNKAQPSKISRERHSLQLPDPPPCCCIPAMPSQPVTILQQLLRIQYWSHYMNSALTSFVQPRSFSFHFAGIV